LPGKKVKVHRVNVVYDLTNYYRLEKKKMKIVEKMKILKKLRIKKNNKLTKIERFLEKK